MRQISLISSGHSIQMQKNTPSSQVHMEHFPGQKMLGHILGHILNYKSNLSKFKKIEIISSIFSNHQAMRLDINYKKNVRNTNTYRLNNTFLNNQLVTEEVKREIRKFLETNDTENTIQNLWDAAKAALRGKFIAIESYPRNKKNIKQTT